MIKRPFWADLNHSASDGIAVQPIGKRDAAETPLEDLLDIMSIGPDHGVLALSRLPESQFHSLMAGGWLHSNIRRMPTKTPQMRQARGNCLDTLERITFK